MRPEKRFNKHRHHTHAAKCETDTKTEEESKIDMLRIHVGMLQSQIATMSLTIASMQSQIKKIEESLPPPKIPIIIPPEENEEPSFTLFHESNLDSDGYDTDDSPLQTHRVKTRNLKSARQKFIFVPNYVEQPSNANEDSGYDSD